MVVKMFPKVLKSVTTTSETVMMKNSNSPKQTMNRVDPPDCSDPARRVRGRLIHILSGERTILTITEVAYRIRAMTINIPMFFLKNDHSRPQMADRRVSSPISIG